MLLCKDLLHYEMATTHMSFQVESGSSTESCSSFTCTRIRIFQTLFFDEGQTESIFLQFLLAGQDWPYVSIEHSKLREHCGVWVGEPKSYKKH